MADAVIIQGRVSADGNATSLPDQQDGQTYPLLVDEKGRIWTVKAPTGGATENVQGNVGNDQPDLENGLPTNPVKVGGHAVAAHTGLPVAVGVDDRVDAAFDQNGRQIVIAVPSTTVAQQVEGNVLNDDPDGATRPVKVGGRAVASVSGLAVAVVADDRVDAAFDLNGRQVTTPTGNVLHDAPDAGGPVKIGARAAADSSAGFAAVAANDPTDIAADPNGRLLVMSQGDVANDAPDTGNPVKIGGVAVATATTGLPVAVAAADRVAAAFDLNGRQIVVVGGDQAQNSAVDTTPAPVKIGGQGLSVGQVGTAITSGRRTNAIFSVNGALHTLSSPNPIADGTSYAYTRLSPTAGDATGAIVVKASAGRLRRCTVYNNDAANALWVQIHNDAALPPVSGGRAWGSVPIPALGFVEIDFSEADLALSAGIMLALSTTPMAYTAAAVTGEFSAQYA